MAQSPAHKFGQIIGDILEAATVPLLQGFADRHGLFLDKAGRRPARRGSKVGWVDAYGNKHDLDFVLEKGGTADSVGTPIAFIEVAWRRYTKHSRNKAQEIQGAILPLVARHQDASPFIGAILAGVFTHGALGQLRSLGFTVLYFPYETVVDAFRRISVDASYDEKSADIEVARKVSQWETLSVAERNTVAQVLLETNAYDVDQFIADLARAIQRQVEFVRVLPLHGTAFQWQSLQEAIGFIESYDERAGCLQGALRWEVEVRYQNGSRLEARFPDKVETIRFLRSFQPPDIWPADVSST